ncbi:MAG: endonuclease III [Thermomicrobiales bacterium]|nr:endonuclease III [Thermomicrobiales bacterium]
MQAWRTSHIAQRLVEHYGTRRWSSSGDPVGELVATILSQNTSDVNSMRAYASLRRSFPTWEAVIAAPESDLADSIRSGGLANIKAPRIQAVLREILAQFPNGDLSELASLPVEEARRALTDLPGVGMKTASCVLLFSLGLPAMPVDTHIHRVSRRTGMIGERTSADAAHGILEGNLAGDVDSAYQFHLDVIHLGREICLARTPKCAICPITEYCAHYQTHGQ